MADAKPRIEERILPSPHPVRIARPDNLKRSFLIIGQPLERIQVRRHWNREAGKTEACTCEPMCPSGREDYFTAALQMLPGASEGERVWEPVVLHLTETTVRGIYLTMRARRDDGDLRGMLVILQRVGGGSGRVTVVTASRAVLTDARPRIDVAGVVAARLRITTDFFGMRFDENQEPASANNVIPPARSRDDKPRVPKGKP